MTTTTPPTPGCLRFPASSGIFALLLFLATVPLALVAQDNPFAENKLVPLPGLRPCFPTRLKKRLIRLSSLSWIQTPRQSQGWPRLQNN